MWKVAKVVKEEEVLVQFKFLCISPNMSCGMWLKEEKELLYLSFSIYNGIICVEGS